MAAAAQQSLDKEIFLDSIKCESNSADYVYLRTVKNYHTIQNEYLVADYYKSGQLQMSGKTLDRDELAKKGPYTYYYENGNRCELVNYEQSVKIGAYFSWFENGEKKVDGEYVKNPANSDSEGILKINQYWNANGKQQVIDGFGLYEDQEDEFTSSRGKIKNGLKDSIWTGFNGNLKISFIEEYKDGALVLGTSTDASGHQFRYKEIATDARPVGGSDSFRKSILKNIPYLRDAKYPGWRLIVSFWVNEEGYIRNVQLHEGISPEIDAKVVSLVRGSAKWQPGTHRGINEKKKFYIPVSIASIINKT